MDKIFCCTGCGIEGDAKCSCGTPYDHLEPSERAAIAIKAHPGMTNRAIAAMPGMPSRQTLDRARTEQNTTVGSNGPTAVSGSARKGKDGKMYKARKPRKTRKPQAHEHLNARGARVGSINPPRAEEITQAQEDAWVAVGQEGTAEGKSHGVKAAEVFEAYCNQIPPMSKTDRAKFDAALRRHQKMLDAQFEERVRQQVVANTADRLAWVKERERKAEQILSRHRGVISEAEWRKLMALHPNSVPDYPTNNNWLAPFKERMTEAFRILQDYAHVLVKPREKPDPNQPQPLPATFDEWIAHRKVH